MGSVKLEELLVEQTWLKVLQGELQKPYAKSLCKFVENEISNGSVPIYPPQQLIFNALNSTPFDKVKAVIIGQDPYHGPGQAMGLCFSVPEGVKAPSSLVNIFKELKTDLGCSIPAHGNLESWAVQVNYIVEQRTSFCMCHYFDAVFVITIIPEHPKVLSLNIFELWISLIYSIDKI